MKNLLKKRWFLGAALAVCLLSGATATTVYYRRSPVHLTLRAGIIRGTGDVYPAARNQFIFSPYSFKEVRSELKSINKMGSPPQPPKKEDQQFDPKIKVSDKPVDPDTVYEQFDYQYPQPDISDEKFKTNCTYYDFSDETTCFTNYDDYELALDRWKQARNNAYQRAKGKVAAWEQQKEQFEDARNKAYQEAYKKYQKAYYAWIEKSETHLDEVLAVKMNHLPIQRLKTDLDGVGKVDLPAGKWYLSGGNTSGFSSIFWNEVPLDVSRQQPNFELANDLGEVENKNISANKEESKISDLILESSYMSELDDELADPDYLKRQLALGDVVKFKNLDDWTLLHLISAAAPIPVRAELTHLVLLYGADPNLAGKAGKTPLHLAAEKNNRASAMLMLAHGADVNLTDHEANSALHLAIINNHTGMAALLLRHQANREQVNGKGETPLVLAARLQRDAIVKLLSPAPSASPSTSASSSAAAKAPIKGSSKPDPKSSAAATKSTAPSDKAKAPAAKASPAATASKAPPAAPASKAPVSPAAPSAKAS